MQKLREKYYYPRILLRELVKTDFKLRYQGSTLGYLWSLLRPLFMFTILYLVFVKFLKINNKVDHPAVYLLLGIVLWNYFVEVTTGSITAIVGKGDLMRKINLPKYVIILAGSASALINLGLNFVVIAIFMVINRVDVTANVLFMIPLVLQLFILSLGVAFWLSALFVKLRDVIYIWDVVTQAGFYLTPVLYLVTLLPDRLAKLSVLNPMAQIIQDARYTLVTKQSATIASYWEGAILWLIPVSLCLIIFATGALYFRSQSKKFAEEV